MAQAETENMNWQPVIGLEVHVELATASKMFCGCAAEHFGVAPNTHTCPICLGLPGALPVPNKKAIEWTMLLGLALGCRINLESKFDRKNYFYPDLPKGYQITQYDQPLGENGQLGKIRIRRVHLEEDTGKLQHQELDGEKVALVDFNRSGVPLVEIVTEPDFRSIEEVDIYLKKLQRIIRYLRISQADMEKGSMRLEPSISISTNGKIPPYRVELKNINSFRFARRALEYEIKRQTEILSKRDIPTQQTRGWNEAKSETVPQRSKEEAHDYRYFPEPDIPPIVYTKDDVDEINKTLPELPETKNHRFIKEYGLSDYDANQLTDSRKTADFFEEAIRVGRDLPAKSIASWMINKKIDLDNTVPAQLIQQIVQNRSYTQMSETEIMSIVDSILAENEKAVMDYKGGKKQVIGYLMGQVLRKNGTIDKNIIEKLILKRMDGEMNGSS